MQWPRKLEALVWEKQFLPSSHACMVFHTNPCNFEIFKTVMKYFLQRYRAQISFYFIKVIWALKCVKERFNDSLKILEFYNKDLHGKPCKGDWVAKVVFHIKMLLTFGGRCNCYFWDIRLKILRSPNFNMLFQLVLT